MEHVIASHIMSRIQKRPTSLNFKLYHFLWWYFQEWCNLVKIHFKNHTLQSLQKMPLAKRHYHVEGTQITKSPITCTTQLQIMNNRYRHDEDANHTVNLASIVSSKQPVITYMELRQNQKRNFFVY